MVKLVLEVNVKAGCEESVLGKLNEVFATPFMSQIEQLTDFYLVLDFTEENVNKVTSIQDLPGILDMKLTTADLAKVSVDKAKEGEEYYVVFVSVENGKREEAMKAICASSDLYTIRNAGYIYDDRADIILEVVSAAAPGEINRAIRGLEQVEDTIFYNLPRTVE